MTVKDSVHSAINPFGPGKSKVWKREATEIVDKLKKPSPSDQTDPDGNIRFIDDQEYEALKPLIERPFTSSNYSRAARNVLEPILGNIDKFRIQGSDGGDPTGDGTVITGGSKRPVAINGQGWPVLVLGSDGKPQNSTIEEGFYRIALAVSRGFQAGNSVAELDAMPLADRAKLAQNAIKTLEDIAQSSPIDGLSEQETNQLKSSVFTTLWYLKTKMGSNVTAAGQIHEALMTTAENETNKFFGRSMVTQLMRPEYQKTIDGTAKTEINEAFGVKYGEKFAVKNILDNDGYISWEHACGHGEGFFQSFVKNVQDKKISGAKFTKTSSSWNSSEFEMTFDPPKTQADGTTVKGIRLSVRNFSDDMFAALGQKKGFSYGGHSNIGANQENSVKKALLQGLKANTPQLAVIGLCAGLDNLDDDLKKLGDLEVLTTFDSSYFWKGQLTDENGNSFEGVQRSEDMEALFAVWKGLVEGDNYEQMENRVEDALDQFYWIDHSGVDPNYVFPTRDAYQQIRWLHLDGDDDGRMDAGDILFQFGLKKAQKDSVNELKLVPNEAYADELYGDDLKNAVLDLNVATHYNSQTSDNSQVVHKFMADGYFDDENNTGALIRFSNGTNPFDGKPIFKAEYNSNVAHSSRSALEALTAYAGCVELTDKGKIHGLDETDRKLMGLTFATFALNYDDQSRFTDQKNWSALLAAVGLPTSLPYGPIASLVDAEHHDYSGNLEIVKKYKEQLSEAQLAALANPQAGRGYRGSEPNIA